MEVKDIGLVLYFLNIRISVPPPISIFLKPPIKQGFGIGWHYFRNSANSNVRMMLIRIEVVMGK